MLQYCFYLLSIQIIFFFFYSEIFLTKNNDEFKGKVKTFQNNTFHEKTSNLKRHIDVKINSLKINQKIAVSLMACNRLSALNLSLMSLEVASALYAARWNELIPIYISLDCFVYDMEEMVRTWNRSSLLLHTMWFPEAREQRNSQWADERVARHWLNSVNTLFDGGFHYVVHLEEDHMVTRYFFDDLIGLIGWAPHSFCFNMGCLGDCWGSISEDPNHVTWMEAGNMGVVYSIEFWTAFLKAKDHFCSMIGNWDINIHLIQSQGKLPLPCATYAMPRVGHMLNAGSSRSGKESHELPKISIKEPKSSANVLVDVGRAMYILEESEQGPLLSEDLKSKCLKYAI